MGRLPTGSPNPHLPFRNIPSMPWVECPDGTGWRFLRQARWLRKGLPGRTQLLAGRLFHPVLNSAAVRRRMSVDDSMWPEQSLHLAGTLQQRRTADGDGRWGRPRHAPMRPTYRFEKIPFMARCPSLGGGTLPGSLAGRGSGSLCPRSVADRQAVPPLLEFWL
jgi:hypothetical protein